MAPSYGPACVFICKRKGRVLQCYDSDQYVARCSLLLCSRVFKTNIRHPFFFLFYAPPLGALIRGVSCGRLSLENPISPSSPSSPAKLASRPDSRETVIYSGFFLFFFTSIAPRFGVDWVPPCCYNNKSFLFGGGGDGFSLHPISYGKCWNRTERIEWQFRKPWHVPLRVRLCAPRTRCNCIYF